LANNSNVRVGAVDEAETGLADDQPRNQLSDDRRDPQPRHRGQQRTGKPDGGQQRQGIEVELVHASIIVAFRDRNPGPLRWARRGGGKMWPCSSGTPYLL